jgi:putative Holliday junction resolvase
VNAVYLGFDYGRRRIGIACGQAITQSATPVDTVAAHGGVPDWPRIDRTVSAWQPQGLVVGIPLHMDGVEQTETHEARRFAATLHRRYALPVFEADERLSSREAEGVIVEARRRGSRRRTRKADVDRMAASIILERWLSEHGGN